MEDVLGFKKVKKGSSKLCNINEDPFTVTSPMPFMHSVYSSTNNILQKAEVES
jgi:hypothetical protein